MGQKCLGGVWDYPLLNLDHFRPMSTKNRINHNYDAHPRKSPYTQTNIF